MPLIHSASKEALSSNIHELSKTGRPHKQVIAIALSEQRKNGRGIGLAKKPNIGVKKSGY